MAKITQNQHYQKSLKNETVIRFITNHPDKDCYDGIVVAVSSKFVAFRELHDLVLKGIVILPKSSIKNLRVGKFEASMDRILRHSKLVGKIKQPKWLLNQKTMRDLIEQIRSRKFWPIIEAYNEDQTDTFLYIGSIEEISKSEFSIYCYDATGKWDEEYLLGYSQIFKIEFGDPYSKYFNSYMRSQDNA